MQKLLELKGVSRRVSDRFSLHDGTLAVEPGQIVGFVGANGAGKTTVFNLLTSVYSMSARCTCLGSAVAPTRPMSRNATCTPASVLSWTRVLSPPRSR